MNDFRYHHINIGLLEHHLISSIFSQCFISDYRLVTLLFYTNLLQRSATHFSWLFSTKQITETKPTSQKSTPTPTIETSREDPGRSSLRAEWAVPGDLVFEHGSTNGGSNGLVRVTGSGASSGGSWRRLRFNETTEQSSLGTTGPFREGNIQIQIISHPKWKRNISLTQKIDLYKKRGY